MKKLTVNASKKYEVLLGENLLEKAGQLINQVLPKEKVNTLCIISDENVFPIYGLKLTKALEKEGYKVISYVFPGGEKTKTMETCAQIMSFLAQNHITRSDGLIALGGGIVGDLTGFAAATFLRGIEYIQIPTTILAAVDSSVGGKTGVNLPEGKNLAGAFYQPSMVIYDVETVKTLSEDIKVDGIIEAFKAGLIGNLKLMEDILKNTKSKELSNEFILEMAFEAIKLKKQVVETDEKDKGERQLLNLGHTIGHAIEKVSQFEISHGKAVAMGMYIIGKASTKAGWSEEDLTPAIKELCQNLGIEYKCKYTKEELLEAALGDKKRMGENITLVIPFSKGKSILKTIKISQLEKVIEDGLTD